MLSVSVISLLQSIMHVTVKDLEKFSYRSVFKHEFMCVIISNIVFLFNSIGLSHFNRGIMKVTIKLKLLWILLCN